MITIPTKTSADKPEGSPFYIDQCPFVPGSTIDYAVLSLPEGKILSWPMVYILANDDTAYVGQTTSVATRMGQHGANEEKRDFSVVNIIFNEEFNSSVVTDYEHRLIGLMHADGRYRLTNKNEGMTDTNYFSKDRYSEMFEELWEELRRLELADHSIAQIEESEVFRYSPYKGLTPDQRVALEKILGVIADGLDNAQPIVIEGMPGTGKTILAIYLLKALKDDEKYKGLNIKLLEPVTSLRETLRKSLAGVTGLSKDDIIGPADIVKTRHGYKADGEKSFDILLVDEAHKLKRRVNLGTQFGNFDKVNAELGFDKEATQVDWIMGQASLPVFFYDPMQSVGPSCVGPDAIRSAIGPVVDEPIRLDSQMRVRGGKEYLQYVSAILAGELPKPLEFEGYDFVLHDSFECFVNAFEKTYAVHDLSRIIAGYAWEWKSKGRPDAHDIEFEGIRLRWNCTYDNWVGKGAMNPDIAHEVGCIHSIQGYDLSYAFVIIGEDIELGEGEGALRANRDNYFDRNGKATATQEELDQYIRNIYYVLLTRGIHGTHVYVANPRLREYFAQFLQRV